MTARAGLGLGVLAGVIALGCAGRWISRDEAYQLDLRNCEARSPAEAVERCKRLVEHRYDSYFRNGEYPSTSTP